MARTRQRSPNYPAISLAEAQKRVREIHAKEGRNPAGREVMVQHLGYSGLTGASLPILSALIKYGLLEGAKGDELRVSDLALSILYPQSGEERDTALRTAANKPRLFSEINQKWPDRPPSDASLKAYLARREFSQRAIDTVIQRYKETMELVSGANANDDDSASTHQEEAQDMERAPRAQDHTKQPPAPSRSGMRVSFTGGELEVSARLSDVKSIDRLISALNANKILLQTVEGAMDTGEDDGGNGNDKQ